LPTDSLLVGCLNAITLLKETISHYKQRNFDVFCAMSDLSQAYDRININIFYIKLNRTKPPEPISNIIEYMCRNTFVNTVYGGQPSDFWPVGNGTRQGGITAGVLFNFYINEVLDTIMNLPVGCSLSCSKMNILCYADDIPPGTPPGQNTYQPNPSFVPLCSIGGTVGNPSHHRSTPQPRCPPVSTAAWGRRGVRRSARIALRNQPSDDKQHA